MERLIGGQAGSIPVDRMEVQTDFGRVLDEFGLEKSSLRADLLVSCPKMGVLNQKWTFSQQKWAFFDERWLDVPRKARNRETDKKS